MRAPAFTRYPLPKMQVVARSRTPGGALDAESLAVSSFIISGGADTTDEEGDGGGSAPQRSPGRSSGLRRGRLLGGPLLGGRVGSGGGEAMAIAARAFGARGAGRPFFCMP